jgi:hypothetical protein
MIKGLSSSQVPFDQKSYALFKATDLNTVIKYQVHPLNLKTSTAKQPP